MTRQQIIAEILRIAAMLPPEDVATILGQKKTAPVTHTEAANAAPPHTQTTGISAPIW